MKAAQAAQKTWKKVPLAERREILRQLGGLLIANAKEIGELFTQEQGRPLEQAIQEVQRSGIWLKTVAKTEIPVEVTEDSETRRIEVHHDPLGVIAAIVPWNFPVSLAIWKVAPALLTGNTVVLKPSPFTPLTMLKIGELFRELLPPGVLNIITGGDELGPAMTAHPGFAKISFTGSTATGKRVMASAAADLKRVTLELGGNDPCIVLPDVDLDDVAKKIFFGAFYNTAQVCVATKRLYVHEDIYDDLRDRLVALAAKRRVGDGMDPKTAFGPIQNAPQFKRVMELLEDAKTQGLKVISSDNYPHDSKGYFVPLTIVDNPPEDSRVVQEEAFGPILPMLKYSNLDDVIELANATDYGLASAVWAGDVDKAVEVAKQIDSGVVWINENLMLDPGTPFAGRKQSGLGVENGLDGLLEFTQRKAIYIPKPKPVVAA